MSVGAGRFEPYHDYGGHVLIKLSILGDREAGGAPLGTSYYLPLSCRHRGVAWHRIAVRGDAFRTAFTSFGAGVACVHLIWPFLVVASTHVCLWSSGRCFRCTGVVNIPFDHLRGKNAYAIQHFAIELNPDSNTVVQEVDRDSLQIAQDVATEYAAAHGWEKQASGSCQFTFCCSSPDVLVSPQIHAERLGFDSCPHETQMGPLTRPPSLRRSDCTVIGTWVPNDDPRNEFHL